MCIKHEMDPSLPVAVLDAIFIVNALHELRDEDGAGVLINCANPDGTGPDNEAVEVTSDWTNWQPRRFEGQTLKLALENAVHEKRLRNP